MGWPDLEWYSGRPRQCAGDCRLGAASAFRLVSARSWCQIPVIVMIRASSWRARSLAALRGKRAARPAAREWALAEGGLTCEVPA